MRIRITVGDVDLRVDGMELTKRDVARLMNQAASIAIVLPQPAAETPADPNPIGFTSQIERAPEYQEQDLSWYFEDTQTPTP